MTLRFLTLYFSLPCHYKPILVPQPACAQAAARAGAGRAAARGRRGGPCRRGRCTSCPSCRGSRPSQPPSRRRRRAAAARTPPPPTSSSRRSSRRCGTGGARPGWRLSAATPWTTRTTWRLSVKRKISRKWPKSSQGQKLPKTKTTSSKATAWPRPRCSHLGPRARPVPPPPPPPRPRPASSRCHREKGNFAVVCCRQKWQHKWMPCKI